MLNRKCYENPDGFTFFLGRLRYKKGGLTKNSGLLTMTSL